MIMGWFRGHWDGFGVVLGALCWLWGGLGALGWLWGGHGDTEVALGWFWAHRDGFGVVMGPSDPSTCAVSSAFRPFQPLFPLFPPRFVVFSPFPRAFRRAAPIAVIRVKDRTRFAASCRLPTPNAFTSPRSAPLRFRFPETARFIPKKAVC